MAVRRKIDARESPSSVSAASAVIAGSFARLPRGFALARGASLAACGSVGSSFELPAKNEIAITASDDAGELSSSFEADDLVLVTTKAYSLDGIAPAAKRFAERGALVVPFLNGVQAADRLVELGVPRAQVIGGVTYISAVRMGPGVVVRRSTFQRLIVGELPNGISARAKKVATMFADAGAEATASEDITLALWQKFVFLASIAAACGLTRLPIGRSNTARRETHPARGAGGGGGGSGPRCRAASRRRGARPESDQFPAPGDAAEPASGSSGRIADRG